MAAVRGRDASGARQHLSGALRRHARFPYPAPSERRWVSRPPPCMYYMETSV